MCKCKFCKRTQTFSDSGLPKFFRFRPRASTGQSTADRRNRQPEVHSTQGNEGVAYHTDEDQTLAMEEDYDQDQREDHCSSMVYSNGQTTNTLNWKQRKNIKNHNKSVTKAKNKKIKKKEKRKNERSQTHNCMHPEEEEMV